MSVARKKDHLRICLEEVVETGSTGFENYRLVYNALPEIDFASIDTAVNFLGKKLTAPILISPLTGGTPAGERINRNLAKAAQKVGVAMGVGSQRVALEEPKLAATFRVRKEAPNIVLLANLGAAQLNYGGGIEQCRQAVAMIGADGLILHLNALQEAIQPEGNTNFSGLLAKIRQVVAGLAVPVIVKEVGMGINKTVALKLKKVGIKFVDVAGGGGTNWALVEGIRRGQREWGEIGSDLALPTTEVIKECAQISGLTVIGSGGIRNGLEIAKAMALGADLVGIGLPFLKPALQSEVAVEKFLNKLIFQLKVVMFALGGRDINELKSKSILRKIQPEI